MSITCHPVPICFDPVLWFDGKNPTGNQVTPTTGASVPTWFDRTGRGNSATQATPANQPTFVSGGGLSFNGSSTVMMTVTTTGTIGMTNTDLDIFGCVNYSVSGANSGLMGISGGHYEVLVPFSGTAGQSVRVVFDANN